MIAKWEKVGKSYKGFIFFPKPNDSLKKRSVATRTKRHNRQKRLVSYSDSDSDPDSDPVSDPENKNEIDNNAYSWWNPISWIV
jgi:hypothetical protein